MSIKDLEPLEPTSPFYPTFIPTGQQTSVLYSKVKTYSSSILSGSGEIEITQGMGVPLGANVAYFNCQLLSPNGISNHPFSPFIKLANINYDSYQDDMTFSFEWGGLVASDTPIVVCSVLYFL